MRALDRDTYRSLLFSLVLDIIGVRFDKRPDQPSRRGSYRSIFSNMSDSDKVVFVVYSHNTCDARYSCKG